MGELKNVIFVVNLGGFLFYFATIWAVVLGKRNIMLGCFASGSLLMSVGLVAVVGFSQEEVKDVLGAYFISALAWLVFGAIILSTKSFCESNKTYKEVINRLDGGINISNNEDIVGYWCVWDKSYRHQEFCYELVEVYKVSTMLNTITGEQHYQTRTLCDSKTSVGQIKAYYDKFKGTPIKVGNSL